MEALIKSALKTKTLKPIGGGGGGCINKGEAYETDDGTVFVKSNDRSGARVMFDGEYEGLLALHKTETIKVPKPMVVLDNPKGGAVLVTEYLLMQNNSQQSKLGAQLAALHNDNLRKKGEGSADFISKFGFHINTCCGYIPQNNTWNEDWVTFYTEQKLQHQFNLLQKKDYDREAFKLWEELKPKIPSFFENITIVPSLLHGDLWSGNFAQMAGRKSEEPVIFDPATFYGHHEYDLAITTIFGGFNHSFYSSYHKVIPKEPGFEQRHILYELFHYLNHWNHFGGGYRSSSISSMKQLLK